MPINSHIGKVQWRCWMQAVHNACLSNLSFKRQQQNSSTASQQWLTTLDFGSRSNGRSVECSLDKFDNRYYGMFVEITWNTNSAQASQKTKINEQPWLAFFCGKPCRKANQHHKKLKTYQVHPINHYVFVFSRAPFVEPAEVANHELRPSSTAPAASWVVDGNGESATGSSKWCSMRRCCST